MTGRHLILGLILIVVLSVQATAAPVQLIVQLKSNSLLGGVLNLLNGVVLDSIPEANLYLISVPTLPILSDLVMTLNGILWSEPNAGVPQPPMARFGVLTTNEKAADWYRYQPAFKKVRAQEALAFSTGSNVVIADINSLVDYSHPAIRQHLTTSYDLVSGRSYSTANLNQSSSGFLDQSSSGFLDQSSSGFLDGESATFLQQSSSGFLDTGNLPFANNPAYSHGTLTVGVMAAIAPNALIMPVRAFDDQGDADLFTLAKAIRQSVTGRADIINMSWGTTTDSKAIRSAIEYAMSTGVILVASAGNSNTSSPQYPAAYSGVITVAATDINDVKGSFSNYGKHVELDGPGVNIISAYPDDLYAMVSGTSFSAPIVAAELALVRSIKFYGVTTSVTSTTVNIDAQNPKYIGLLGSGRVDILKAVRGY